ncbi:phage portal protein [Hathewaya massiliensis]|uniref:phage portal protein n=1 Tax=Hathewaya massiliensis TaxID=1964382 RepID=UPI001157D92C|nr:phage portal protein [Hathewaya massiliensis]
MHVKDIKETLLKLSNEEKKERKKALKDFLFYLGECENMEEALIDNDLLGQSWLVLDDLDYVPSQVVDNKVKPLINKQARFMFGRSPDILFKPFDKKDREKCEDLRRYIDSILGASKFWSNTMKTFRIASVTKRVMLRLEANPGQPVRLYYHDINDFNYEVDPNDANKLKSVVLIRQDSSTSNSEDDKQLWYRYTYFLKENEEDNKSSCFLKKETFIANNLDTPIDTEEMDTGIDKIPCWIIVNEQSIINPYGSSDIKDLKPLQESYNKRLSDLNDSLRFSMFGQTTIIDATEDTVNACNIAPNALMALRSIEDSEGKRQAQVKRIESSFNNVEGVLKFLDKIDKSMHEKIGVPHPEQLRNIPSAKTLKYIYSELVARCDEKWHDWEPAIRQMIRLIVQACGKFNCYEDWNTEWNDLLYNIVLDKNYPIPEDEEDKKRLAMEEVRTNVRSHRSYIKDFSNEEDAESALKEIAEDITTIINAENEQFLQDT